MRASCPAVLGLLVACSAETSPESRGFDGVQTAPCVAGQTQACTCASGQQGTQRCTTQWAACECMAPPDSYNPPPPMPDASIDRADAGPTEPSSCKPGFYLGTYDCEILLFGFPAPLTGDVSFNLSVNESVVSECEAGEEFCADLIISENSGVLFGLAGLVGFETQLDGALDCTTGEFRATGADGRYGNPISTDPNDPDALWTVEDPPLGMFAGELMGTQQAGSGSAPDRIEGTWNLRDLSITDLACEGPFRVELQP